MHFGLYFMNKNVCVYASCCCFQTKWQTSCWVPKKTAYITLGEFSVDLMNRVFEMSPMWSWCISSELAVWRRVSGRALFCERDLFDDRKKKRAFQMARVFVNHFFRGSFPCVNGRPLAVTQGLVSRVNHYTAAMSHYLLGQWFSSRPKVDLKKKNDEAPLSERHLWEIGHDKSRSDALKWNWLERLTFLLCLFEGLIERKSRLLPFFLEDHQAFVGLRLFRVNVAFRSEQHANAFVLPHFLLDASFLTCHKTKLVSIDVLAVRFGDALSDLYCRFPRLELNHKDGAHSRICTRAHVRETGQKNFSEGAILLLSPLWQTNSLARN